MYKWIFAVVVLIAVCVSALVRAEDTSPTASTAEERIGSLETSLLSALGRIDVLEREVAALKDTVIAPGAGKPPSKKGAPELIVPEGGSSWRGKRYGLLTNGKRITDREGLVIPEATVVESNDTSFTMFIRVRHDPRPLTWNARCELKDGKWTLVQLDVDGAEGRKGLAFTAQRVQVSEKRIVFYWEYKGDNNGTAKETYELTRVN
jgi:hypothetical protein